jgi:hypothetical protein
VLLLCDETGDLNDGVLVGVGLYFPEMGTLLWFDGNEKNRLFKETLAKLKPHIKKIGFRGDMDINCIVNEKGAFPYTSATATGRSPATWESACSSGRGRRWLGE